MASANLGRLGPHQSNPVIFHVSLPRRVLPLLPWLLLFALLLLPGNLNLSAPVALLIPIALFPVSLAAKSERFVFSDEMFLCLTVWRQAAMAFAALWLISHYLAAWRRGWSFAVAVVFPALAVGFIGLCEGIPLAGSVDDSELIVLASLSTGLLSSFIATAMVLSGYWCRKRFSAFRFVLGTTVWLSLMSLVLLAPFIAAETLLRVLGSPSTWEEIRGLLELPPKVAFGSLSLLLPFLILTFTNRLYRERFNAIFRLPGTVVSPGAGEGTPAPETAAK